MSKEIAVKGKHPVAIANEKLTQQEQLLVIAMAKYGNEEDAARAAGYEDLDKAMTVMRRGSFRTSFNTIKKRKMTDTYYSMMCDHGWKVRKLYDLVEEISSDFASAKDKGLTPSHMIDAIKTLNNMQGDNAAEKSVSLSYNVNEMKNVTPGQESDTERLIVEYVKEY